MTTGLGIVTYNRPKFFKVAIDSVIENLLDVVDLVLVYEDHSDLKFDDEYTRIFESLGPEIGWFRSPENQGVCKAKNWLLREMYEFGCDYLFLMEDDQRIKSPGAITRYIEAHKTTGYHHFLFAHHGPANIGKMVEKDENLEYYLNTVGAYCFYTRELINRVGYMDESFDKNCWEHVEYDARIARHPDLAPPFWHFPDIPDSRELIEEQPGAIQSSAIRQGPNWGRIVEEERRRWAPQYPDVWG